MTAPVDFIVVGAMKALTTSVLATLAGHPDVAVSRRKETEYFVAETGWRQGPQWYDAQFAHAQPGQRRGEASPQYTFFPVYAGVAERIAATAPAARLVYLLRDPVARATSQWRHARARGVEERPLDQALLHDARYLFPSLYWLQLEQYLARLPEEQILVVDTQQLIAEPAHGLGAICRHIGVDPTSAPAVLARLNTAEDTGRPTARAQRWRRHDRARQAEQRLRERLPRQAAAGWDRLTTEPNPAPVLDADLEQRLRAVFAADLARLRAHLGDRAPSWTEPVQPVSGRRGPAAS